MIAVLRKLAVIMHRTWADGTELRWNREAATHRYGLRQIKGIR